MVSVFLPWYSDLDTRNIASQFNGLNGPLYLIGYFILISAAASFAFDFSSLIGKKIEFEKLAHWQVGIAIQSLFLIVLSYSIYSHNKFGLGYISTKSYHSGIYLAGFAAMALALGGALKIYYKDSVSVITHIEGAENDDEDAIKYEFEEDIADQPKFRVERTQAGIETRVHTVVDSYQNNNNKIDV